MVLKTYMYTQRQSKNDFVKGSGHEAAMWIHVLLCDNVHWGNIFKKLQKLFTYQYEFEMDKH